MTLVMAIVCGVPTASQAGFAAGVLLPVPLGDRFGRQRLILVQLTAPNLPLAAAARFSTRAVCAIANVTAPTLHHHSGSVDGLLSAAIAEAVNQFLEGKRIAKQSSGPATALRQRCDNYVRFAAERPRLYAAMIGRVLLGATIPVAEQARAVHMKHITTMAAQGRLTMPAEAAADITWACAHAASILYVTAQGQTPDLAVIDSLRDHAMRAIFKSGKAKKT